MAQSIEDAGKVPRAANRGKAGVSIPATGRRGINIGAQCVVSSEASVHALQVGSCRAACRSQLGNYGVADKSSVGAQLGAEVIARGQINGGIHVVGAGVSCSHRTLTVSQRQFGRDRAVHGAVDIDVILCAQGQGVRAPGDGIVDIDITGRAGASAGTRNGYITSTKIGGQRTARHVTTAGGNGEVFRINQPCAALATGCPGGDFCRIRHLHLRGAGLNKAAITAIRRTGVQRARHVGGSRDHAAHQHDLTVMILHRPRLHDAVAVYHAGQQGIARTGIHGNDAAIRLNQAVVSGKAVQHALVHPQLQQTVAVKRERHLVARTHAHRAEFGDNHTVVHYPVAQQRHIAAVRCVNHAIVDDLTRTLAREGLIRLAEGGIADVQRRGHQPAHVHLRALAEEDAIGVDQIDLPVGVQMPHDTAAVDIEDSIHGNRLRIGLLEVHRLAGGDIETLPVQRQMLAGLLDGGDLAAVGDAA